MRFLPSVIGSLILLLTGIVDVRAEENTEKGVVLDATAETTKKQTVLYGQLGPRSTLLFYTFANEKAVLQILIGNKDTTFPISATLYKFADNTTAEGISRWINNQHSDGIYPEVPEPKLTSMIPAECCKVISKKLGKQKTAQFGNFDEYTIEFQINNVPAAGGVKLKDFKDTTKVNVKVQPV